MIYEFGRTRFSIRLLLKMAPSEILLPNVYLITLTCQWQRNHPQVKCMFNGFVSTKKKKIAFSNQDPVLIKYIK
jgi:hypothetical protein